uniref:CCHC-type domain-containing protein n=1 Tax=Nicotiana tabacum TaxID=4097 RepID=A0A1S4BRJ4_TOBAC|nr:PREDICTED: uncharacterized protein LOC107811082 [Nicotiana tabacum]
MENKSISLRTKKESQSISIVKDSQIHKNVKRANHGRRSNPEDSAEAKVKEERRKRGNLPIPPKKDGNGQVIVSSVPLDLDEYTEEQSAVITVNAKAKNLLYNAISGEEYEKISSYETAKKMWDGQIQQEKKKTVAFKATVAEPENEEEEEGEEQNENIAVLSKVMTSMMRKNRNSKRGKSNFRKGRMNNDNDKNDGKCYECGKHGHIQAECLELKKKLRKNVQKKKSFGA